MYKGVLLKQYHDGREKVLYDTFLQREKCGEIVMEGRKIQDKGQKNELNRALVGIWRGKRLRMTTRISVFYNMKCCFLGGHRQPFVCEILCIKNIAAYKWLIFNEFQNARKFRICVYRSADWVLCRFSVCKKVSGLFLKSN